MDSHSNWYSLTPDPDDAGWMIYRISDKTRFHAVLGDLAVRREGDKGIVRLRPHHGLTNLVDRIHGAALLGFVDSAIFPAALILGCEGAPAGLTIDVSAQFVGAADAERPIDAVVELSSETARLLFLRGIVEQGGDRVLNFMAIICKPRP